MLRRAEENELGDKFLFLHYKLHASTFHSHLTHRWCENIDRWSFKPLNSSRQCEQIRSAMWVRDLRLRSRSSKVLKSQWWLTCYMTLRRIYSPWHTRPSAPKLPDQMRVYSEVIFLWTRLFISSLRNTAALQPGRAVQQTHGRTHISFPSIYVYLSCTEPLGFQSTLFSTKRSDTLGKHQRTVCAERYKNKYSDISYLHFKAPGVLQECMV